MNQDGYGTWGTKLAHRRVWENERGPIPVGMTIDHTCHDPQACKLGNLCPHRRCVNIEHMELVTAAENRRRSGSHGDNITHCPRNHEYAGANLMISRGARYCRKCRSDAERERRREKRIVACAEAGHAYSPFTDSGGKEYCRTCRGTANKLNGDRHRGRGKGRDVKRQRQRGYERYRRVCEERCRSRGHERVDRRGSDGRMLCAICTASLPGRPPLLRPSDPPAPVRQ